MLVQVGFTRFALRRSEAAARAHAPRTAGRSSPHERPPRIRLALVGNPNCGKTALFNLLTGSRQKVANYAGVTVERKEGRLHAPSGRSYAVLDLPGAYSLHAASLDEAITRDLCRGFYPGEPAPDVIVCVVDATNLRLHLRFALEVRELGQPMVLAVNMMDAAQAARHRGRPRRCWSASSACRWCRPWPCSRDGAAALVAKLDAIAGTLHEPRAHLAADAALDADALHAETRRLLVARRERCRAAPPRSTTRSIAGCCIRWSACCRWRW